MQRVAIGVMVFNEAANLGRLLEVLCAATVHDAVVESIIVVSSGSHDGSEEIAQEWAMRDPRVRLIREPVRRGKARAINLFLESLPEGVEICVLSSADILPRADTLDLLVSAFRDASVGMAGVRPVPTNPRAGWLNQVVRCQWELHHEVAVWRPKLGELVAFRNVIRRIDPTAVVDEAGLEAEFVGRGMRLTYVSDAVVYNRGPATLTEFFNQRRRIWSGHLWLRRETGYEVSTYRVRTILRALARYVGKSRRMPLAVIAAAGLEILARTMGTADVLLRRKKPTIWSRLDGTKDLGAALPAEEDDRSSS